MIRTTRLIAAACLLGVIGAAPAAAQQAAYRRVGSNEVLDGYVKDGERIETQAHVWSEARGVFLNFNRASARLPFRLDLAGVEPALADRLRRECKAETQFHGGCQATLRGAPSRADGQRIFFVKQIVAIEPGR